MYLVYWHVLLMYVSYKIEVISNNCMALNMISNLGANKRSNSCNLILDTSSNISHIRFLTAPKTARSSTKTWSVFCVLHQDFFSKNSWPLLNPSIQALQILILSDFNSCLTNHKPCHIAILHKFSRSPPGKDHPTTLENSHGWFRLFSFSVG